MGAGASASARQSADAKAVAKAAVVGGQTTLDIEDKVKQTFKEWDTDGNGSISKDELVAALTKLNGKLSKKDVEKLFKEADVDSSGTVSYDEMVDWVFCAPNLERYFKKSEEIMKKQVADAAKLQKDTMKAMEKAMQRGDFSAMQKIGTKAAKLQKDAQQRIEKELTPIIKKSFEWHDKDESKVLEFGEATIFFSNFVRLAGPHFQTMAEMSTTQLMGPLDGVGINLGNVQKLCTESFPAKVEAYKSNADEFNKKAFSVLDVSGDGKLQEEEVVQALLHGSPKNTQFLIALGLQIDPQEAMEAAMQDIGTQCEQM